MTFKDQMAADAVNVFLNSDEFAEVVTYTPKNGTPRTIKAIVERQRLKPDGETDRTFLDQVEITIANHATYGASTINKGGDKVTLAKRVGGDAVEFVVADILVQDEGTWKLLLEG